MEVEVVYQKVQMINTDTNKVHNLVL